MKRPKITILGLFLVASPFLFVWWYNKTYFRGCRVYSPPPFHVYIYVKCDVPTRDSKRRELYPEYISALQRMRTRVAWVDLEYYQKGRMDRAQLEFHLKEIRRELLALRESSSKERWPNQDKEALDELGKASIDIFNADCYLDDSVCSSENQSEQDSLRGKALQSLKHAKRGFERADQLLKQHGSAVTP